MVAWTTDLEPEEVEGDHSPRDSPPTKGAPDGGMDSMTYSVKALSSP